MTAVADPSLNEALAAIGWTSAPARFGVREIYDDQGRALGRMTASDAFAAVRRAMAKVQRGHDAR